MRLTNTRATISGLAVMLAGLAGCAARSTAGGNAPAGGARPAGGQPMIGQVAKVTDWRQITLPLDAYEPSLRDTVLVERAVSKQTNVCAQRFGMKFAPPVNKRDQSALDSSYPSHYRLYGLLDEVHAAAKGYRETGTYSLKEATYSKQVHPSAYYNVIAAKMGGGVYKGRQIPAGGCIGEARREVAGAAVVPDTSLPETLSSDAWHLSNIDTRVTAAFSDWSACMAHSGFYYRTPMEANDDPKWTGDKASKAEIAVAVGDVRCKKQTNLTGIRMAVDSAYELVAINTNTRALAALEAGQQLQVRSAARIVASK